MPSPGGKILGILLYMIPWVDSLKFGNHLYLQYPFTQIIQIPAIPIIIIERSIPFGNLLLFLAIFIGLVRNSKVSYFLRFNALQALLIDIGVIIINYAFTVIIQPFGKGVIIGTLSSTVLIAVLAIVIFAFGECLQGKEPELPTISEAVRMQL